MYSVSIRACNRCQPHQPHQPHQRGYRWQLHYNMCVSYIYRPVLRLMYRIHTHIHYIISYQELITYCTRFLSPLSSYPYFCIVASYTAICIPLILVCGSVLYCHYSKLFQYVKYRFVFTTPQTYSIFDYAVYFVNIHYKLSPFLPKSIQFIYIF